MCSTAEGRSERHVFAEGGQDRNKREGDAQWKTRHVFPFRSD
jgi:hypothetical protein